MEEKINKALKHLQKGHFSGYFEELGPIVPDELKFRYNELRDEFSSPSYSFNFHEKLRTFAQNVRDNMHSTPEAPPTILTIFANPDNDLDLIHEQKNIQDALRGLDSKNQIKHVSLFEANRDDFFNYVGDYKVTIFHYAGHADEKGIELHGGYASFAPLAKKLMLHQEKHIKLVFLNGCATFPHVDLLFELGAPVVIATANKVADKQATKFAIHFYEMLAAGHSIKVAYESAESYVTPNNSNSRFRKVISTADKDKLKKDSSEFPWGLYLNEQKDGEKSIEFKLSDGLVSSFSTPTPPSPTINGLTNDQKDELKELFTDDPGAFFTQLKSHIANDANKKNLLLQKKNELKKLNTKLSNGHIRNEDFDVQCRNIEMSLYKMVDELQ